MVPGHTNSSAEAAWPMGPWGLGYRYNSKAPVHSEGAPSSLQKRANTSSAFTGMANMVREGSDGKEVLLVRTYMDMVRNMIGKVITFPS